MNIWLSGTKLQELQSRFLQRYREQCHCRRRSDDPHSTLEGYLDPDFENYEEHCEERVLAVDVGKVAYVLAYWPMLRWPA